MKLRLPFVVFLGISGALHAAGAIAIAPRSDSMAIEGGGSASPGLLGESFEDLAQGAQPVAPAATAAVTAPAVPVAAAPPIAALSASPAPRLDLPVSDNADLSLSSSPHPSPPVAPPVADAVVAPVPVPALAAAQDAQLHAPETSMRPRQRAEKPVEQPQRADARPAAPAGNADRNARKGSQSGQETASATAASQGNGAQSAEAGTAARSSYPGLVLRKIERTRKPSVSARGSVVVAFHVAPSGALASAQVTRSSGDPSLERAALDHIRRAAPFPPPPSGADTRFSFEFVGRR